MFKFLLKTLLLISVLLVGILIGMEKASEEMDKMRSTDELGAFNLNRSDDGTYTAEVLGENITSDTLKEKQDKLQELKTFNFFSEIGTRISNIITSVFQGLLSFIFNLLGKI